MKIKTAALALVCIAACDSSVWGGIATSSGGDGTGDTGSTEGKFWCDELGVCLLALHDSPEVIKLIDDGLFTPHSRGDCTDPGRTWDAFTRAFPVDSGVTPRLQAACCADMGCEGLDITTTGFAICMTEPATGTWSDGGTVGAIGFGPQQWQPACGELEPYAFAHDYTLRFSCQYGVSCLDLRTECGCTCDNGWCDFLSDQLEQDYGITPFDREASCTGYPWVWDRFAFGTGGWVGDTCQFDQPDPAPGTIPSPLQAIIDEIQCVPGQCSIPKAVLDEVKIHPDLVGSSTVRAHGNGLLIEECRDLCAPFGLADAMIVSVGLEARSPLSPEAWLEAEREWLAGETRIHYVQNDQPQVLTITIAPQTTTTETQ